MKVSHDFEYDVIVLGSGLTGAHIAHDAALRGLRTLWLTESDIVGESLSWDKLLLQYVHPLDPFQSSQCTLHNDEVNILRQRAHHLLSQTPLLVPVFHPSRSTFFQRTKHTLGELLRAKVSMHRYNSFSKLAKHQGVFLREQDWNTSSFGIRNEGCDYLSSKEWMISHHRWVLGVALSAREAGVTIQSYTEVEDWVRTASGKVRGVYARDILTSERQRYTSYTVVNARSFLPDTIDKEVKWNQRLRFKRQVHLLVEQQLPFALQFKNDEHQTLSITPQNNSICLSWSDPSVFLLPEMLEPNHQDVLRVMELGSKLIPSLKQRKLLRCYSTISKFVVSSKFDEKKLPGYHVSHHKKQGMDGLFSSSISLPIWARKCAEEVVDRLCKSLKIRAFCTTVESKLVGGESDFPTIEELNKEFSLPKSSISALIGRHGDKSYGILFDSQRTRDGLSHLCQSLHITVGELRYCLEHEWIRKPENLIRSIGLGLEPNLGTASLLPASRLLQKTFIELSLQNIITSIEDELHKYQTPVLFGQTLQQKIISRS